MLNREQILKVKDIKTEVVPVPEWNGEVTVKMMTATERDEYEASIYNSDEKTTDLTNIRAKLCVKTIVDEKGDLMFCEKDIIILGKKSAAALDRIFDVASKLSKISKKDQAEIVKNLGKGQDSGSSTS